MLQEERNNAQSFLSRDGCSRVRFDVCPSRSGRAAAGSGVYGTRSRAQFVSFNGHRNCPIGQIFSQAAVVIRPNKRQLLRTLYELREQITTSLVTRPVLLLLASLWPACSGAQEPKSIVETPVARIHANGEHEQLVKTTGEALEFARESLGNPAGFPQHKIEVHIYDSEQQMADGIMATLGYSRNDSQVIAKVGISSLTSNTLHIHSRTETWGFLFWHAIVHEYAHGMAEERYGMVLPNSARWLYEGLGEFEANRTLSRKFPAFEETYERSRFKVAFKALLFFKLFQFKNILAQEDWVANIANSRERWDIQYAQAYTAVNYLITSYGFDKFAALLTDIKNGRSAKEAMEKVFGLSPLRFELQYCWFVLRMGLFGFYVRYTLALAAIFFLLSLGLLLLLKRRRAIRALRVKPI